MKKLIATIMMFLGSFVFAGDFSNIMFKDFNGKAVNFKKYEGKKTYVKLWASWCPACLSSLPEFANLSKSTKDFNTVSIVFPGIKGEQQEEDFKKWFTRTDFYGKFDLLFDLKGDVFKKVNIRAYPFNVFLDSKGNIVTTRIGVLSSEQIKKIMSEIK